jgi:hypothetical protein
MMTSYTYGLLPRRRAGAPPTSSRSRAPPRCFVAVCCSVLFCVLCCSVLFCVVLCCSVLLRGVMRNRLEPNIRDNVNEL